MVAAAAAAVSPPWQIRGQACARDGERRRAGAHVAGLRAVRVGRGGLGRGELCTHQHAQRWHAAGGVAPATPEAGAGCRRRRRKAVEPHNAWRPPPGRWRRARGSPGGSGARQRAERRGRQRRQRGADLVVGGDEGRERRMVKGPAGSASSRLCATAVRRVSFSSDGGSARSALCERPRWTSETSSATQSAEVRRLCASCRSVSEERREKDGGTAASRLCCRASDSSCDKLPKASASLATRLWYSPSLRRLDSRQTASGTSVRLL